MRVAAERLLVLYDGDCGVCTRTASILRRLDRRGALLLMAAQSADDVAGVPPLAALRVRDRSGRWSAAGAAVVPIAEALPVLRPLALVARIPGAHIVIEAAYAVVASNRHRISRALGMKACPLDPEERAQAWRPNGDRALGAGRPIRSPEHAAVPGGH